MKRRHRAALAAAGAVFSACSPPAHQGHAIIHAPRARDLLPTTTEAPPTTAAEDPTTTLVVEPSAPAIVEPVPGPPSGAGSTPTEAEGGDSAREPGAATAEASWYGTESGDTTASGEPFDPSDYTFANRTMSFGTRVRFCGPLGCVVARCTDRGPWVAGRLFDLSRAAFAAVAPLGAGGATLTWEVLD